jgi:hypothetical protein
MNHCVGSYDHACLFGRSAILSLIDKASGERSTVELRLVNADLNGRRLELVQHRGIRDVAPNIRLIRGLVTLLKDINSDKSQPRFQQMENECLERQASKFSHLSPLEPARFMKLKKALSKHLGYEKFRDAALKALGQEEAVK